MIALGWMFWFHTEDVVGIVGCVEARESLVVVAAASSITSATTSGTSSSMRQRDELSTTTAPASTNRGAHSPLVVRPAENRATSNPWIESSDSARTSRSRSPKSIVRPTERSDANATTSSAGNERSRITPSIVEPTAPVAPTTATRGSDTGGSAP